MKYNSRLQRTNILTFTEQSSVSSDAVPVIYPPYFTGRGRLRRGQRLGLHPVVSDSGVMTDEEAEETPEDGGAAERGALPGAEPGGTLRPGHGPGRRSGVEGRRKLQRE